ncbi:serine/threonine protein kinase [Streptomyces armeniacus]|uniref:Serine/threonine protein kinase n=1 Tax=Streptomyces armeniacus TaxID=83291 RepID=A0A345XZE9_9ACTN|nr:bifunctional serine/threonine-protein kinase/ABC transporter substrate-binding protein [Streptomyces armeniacus]AXK37015.1 serine/threonine protein kinase [Streptomyces armeniacus]
MKPLRPGDPAAIGGRVLLGRLGAGGMGVVYLARSAGGALVALKVIRAEYAADPAFRARFRRETEAAARLSGRWLVPVTAADPHVSAPWLATAYVPGLSLAEAVDGHGALPEDTVRVLGVRLAEALAGVHAEGLVHRDVKPGNVLLALDGPRLIDFGIARADGVTALTASDLVIGSPGFLAPEQAQARAGKVGPPSDVFSLGCVLAYAATGRLPFGAGTVAGALFRTVHEEPELDGAPPALLPLLRDCLTKVPEHRPGTAAVREALAYGQPDGPADGWLPVPLPGIIAERAAEVLALPDPVPAPPAAPAPAAPAAPSARRPSRRAVLGLGATVAVAAGGGLAAVRVAGSRGGAGGAVPRYTIGLHADLSGESSALGRAQERGARLAVARFNAAGDRPFTLELAVRDDRGEASRAARVADRLGADREVVAVLGPTGAGGIEAVAARYEKSLLPMVSVSSPAAELNDERLRQGGAVQLRADEDSASGFLQYLGSVERSEHTVLVDDRAATGDGDWGLAERIEQFPPAGGRVSSRPVPADSEDFGPVAEAVRASGAQAVVFVGASPRRAALCARALDRAGFDGVRMAPEPVLRPELPADGGRARLPFLAEAGDAAQGWVCVTTYADATRLPAARDFARDYAEAFPSPPALGPTAPFALETYDALLLVASALRRPADGGPERGSTVRRLRSARRKGLARPLGFDPGTGRFDPEPGIFLYRVDRGAAVFLGNLDEAEPPGNRKQG